MFGRGKLLGDTRISLRLDTKSGDPIPNEVGGKLPNSDLAKWNNLLKKYRLEWTERKPPDGGYNCFGHVWASRRTCIRDDRTIHQIFIEDKYRKIAEDDSLPGDIAIYVLRNGRGFLHAARIIRIIKEKPIIRTTIVLSKLAEWGGEVIHNVQFVIYGERGKDYDLQFWTDR